MRGVRLRQSNDVPGVLWSRPEYVRPENWDATITDCWWVFSRTSKEARTFGHLVEF